MNKELRTRNPNFRETILRHLERQEFMKHINCRLTLIEPGHVVAEIDIATIHEQQIGFVHGGVVATIADVAAGFAGFTLVAPDEHTVTAEIKISYFSPGIGRMSNVAQASSCSAWMRGNWLEFTRTADARAIRRSERSVVAPKNF